MPFDLAKLVRPEIAEMDAYTPILPFDVLSKRLGRLPDEIVKLDANENPYGPSPRIYEALAHERYYHIYPDPGNSMLREALSRYLSIGTSHIMVGHGADELIDLIMRLLIQPGDAVIDCPPTFGMYSFDAALNGGQLMNISRTSDFSVDIGAIESTVAERSNVKLLFLTCPNNPDGSALSDEELERLLELPIAVILDEAYVEFHGISRVDWVMDHGNLIVLRTFSKWAGLAGLRVGYGVFPEAIMPQLWKIKQPYNVNAAGTVAALESLNDAEHLMGTVGKIVEERERLHRELTGLGFLLPYPSQANFILCRVVDRDARQLKLDLEGKGILVRYFSKPGLTDHIRISVGRPDQTDALLTALRELS
ncbi:MAG: histidinol-phosphate transaminase [Candidatus Poribacteria bacterium]|nr:histidinol-phosphate transaminase [Candidatus Poribacteria bacterium]